MNTNRLYNFLIGILSTTLVILYSTSAQGQTKLINPGISNSFIDDYVLSDGTIRFIGSEHGAERELFFVDRLVDGRVTEPVFFPESFDEIEFNIAGVDCMVLPMPSGDLLLGINQHDCDYAPYSSIARFNQTGDVLWAVSMGNFYFDYFISEFTWVDSNVLCVISDQADTLYFDIHGNEVADNPEYLVFDSVIITNNNKYASSGSTLYRLNDNFKPLDSIMLDNDILFIHSSGDSRIIVATKNSISMIDTLLGLVSISDSYSNFSLVTTSDDWIWIGRKGGDIIQLDYQLHPNDTFVIPHDVHLQSLGCINEELVLGGHYIGILASSMFFHTTPPDEFNFSIVKDIAIEAVQVDEPVHYSFDPAGYPWGFNIPYKNLIVNVSNTGSDTIQSLSIRYQAGSGCLSCNAERVQWDLDSLHLFPGATLEVDLGDFYASCITSSPSSFCIYVLPADSLPEINKENNRLCISVDALLSNVIDVDPTFWKIFPNPAEDIITVSSKSNEKIDRVSIYNSQGVLLYYMKGSNNMMEVPVEFLSPGMYLIGIESRETYFHYEKLIRK